MQVIKNLTTIGKKTLGLSNKQVDAYEDISLIDHVLVFYVEA